MLKDKSMKDMENHTEFLRNEIRKQYEEISRYMDMEFKIQCTGYTLDQLIEIAEKHDASK